MRKLDLSVIILTYNEEIHIERYIKSVYELAKDVFIVDSYSTDKTLEIAKQYTNHIYINMNLSITQPSLTGL